jgi:hypothetical protein
VSKSKSAQLNIDELKGIITHNVKNNRELQKGGKIPVSMEVIGDSGLGKTSAVLQIADELGLDFVKLNLAQIEELGDLIGFPIRQFQVCKTKGDENLGECVWIDEHAVDEYKEMGYTFTGDNRMSYCPPEWIAGRTRGGILLLDDYNRADPRFMQATMELIDRQQYISWRLPEDWHIILTCNPDDGDYNVTSIDNAQKTRFISMNLKFDIDCWARWAEANGIDGRCINFLLMHPELVTKDTNARSITTFFNSISSLESFETNLPLIQLFGEGSVGQEFAHMFTMFINNKLDKLMSPKDILFGKSEDHVIKTLKKSIGDHNNYRADIASTIGTRITNYSLWHAETNSVDKELLDRIGALITEDVFTNDLKFNIVRTIHNGNKVKFRLLTMNQGLVKYVLA